MVEVGAVEETIEVDVESVAVTNVVTAGAVAVCVVVEVGAVVVAVVVVTVAAMLVAATGPWNETNMTSATTTSMMSAGPVIFLDFILKSRSNLLASHD